MLMLLLGALMPMPDRRWDIPRSRGRRAYGEADLAGQEMVDALHQCGLLLPSTFDEIHEGEDATFRHLCGQEHRIDFTVIGGGAEVVVARSSVATDFDTANKLEDHKAVQLYCTFQIGPVRGSPQLRQRQDAN